jgi:hypothetical protein
MRSFLITGCLVIVTSLFCAGYKLPPKIHRYDHVIVVIEENHAYNQLIGSSNAPYINQLAEKGALFTNSHGIGHPSQPNYMVLFSGATQGVTDDNCLNDETPFVTPNLGASLIKHGFSFKGYAHTMPSAGFLGCVYKQTTLTVGYLYARKHCPWVNWIGDKANNIPPSASLPMTDFPKDFNKLPTLSFVIPDMDYDMHNIGLPGDTAAIKRGDKWLKENLSSYVKWAKSHNSLLILTFDEDDYVPANGNKIPTIFVGAKIKPGKFGNVISHYNVFHTLESMYNLPNEDGKEAPPITDIWEE